MTGNSNPLIKRGYEARREHRLDDARRLFAEAIDSCRMAKDHNGLAQGLAGLAQISRDSDDGTGARRHYEEAVAIYRVLHDDLKLAHTIRHLADILRHQGDNVLAESCYAEALHIYRQSESTVPLDLANTIRGYALLKGNCGETEVAIGLWREAKSLYASLKVQDGVDESDQYLSRLTQA